MTINNYKNKTTDNLKIKLSHINEDTSSFIENSLLDDIFSLVKPTVYKNIKNSLINVSKQLNLTEFDVVISMSTLTSVKETSNSIHNIMFLVYSNEQLLGMITKKLTIKTDNTTDLIYEILFEYKTNDNNVINEIEDFLLGEPNDFYLQTYSDLELKEVKKTQKNLKDIFNHLKLNDIFSCESFGLHKINIEYIIGKDIKWSLAVYEDEKSVKFSPYYDINKRTQQDILKAMISCNIIHKSCLDDDILDDSLENIFSLSTIYDY